MRKQQFGETTPSHTCVTVVPNWQGKYRNPWLVHGKVHQILSITARGLFMLSYVSSVRDKLNLIDVLLMYPDHPHSGNENTELD